MIDWVSCKIPFEWEKPFNGGELVAFNPEGVQEWSALKRMSLEGSHSAQITVRSVFDKSGVKMLEISGNPAKFMQGHNLFGTNDLRYLMGKTIERLCELLGYRWNRWEYARWWDGDYTISRIDINEMIALGSRERVRSVIRALGEVASMKHRGKGCFVGDTLYFGKAAKGKQVSRSMLKMYCKADELELHDLPRNVDEWEKCKSKDWGGKLAAFIEHRDALCGWADDKLRIEATFSRKELFDRDLNYARMLTEPVICSLYSDLLAKLRLGDVMINKTSDLDCLPRSLRRSYDDWMRGDDLRDVLPRETFRRHRLEIMRLLGVDISILNPKRQRTVVLREVVKMDFVPCSIPEWALGTSLLCAA